MKRLLIYILAAFLAVSCIYPFEAEVSGEYSRVVIDGNIIIGGTSVFNVTRMQPLGSGISEITRDPMSGKAWIEASNGTEISPVSSEGGWKFTFDTEFLDKSLQYCFHFQETSSGKEYVSSMESMAEAPAIDRLHYDSDASNVEILIDLSAVDVVDKCRWDFKEIWEYTADFTPDYEFNTRYNRVVELSPREKDPYAYYYCWDESYSRGYGLADMSGQTEAKAADKHVTSISRTSKKLSSLYKIEVTTLGLSDAAYDYYSYMESISEVNGNLFSPNPSEVRGNIVCIQDPDEFVAGYVTVTSRHYDELWIEKGFYKQPDFMQKLSVPGRAPISEMYEGGLRPAFYGEDAMGNYGLLWGPMECVDCRGYGGTKTRPENWPTKNY